MGDLQRLIETYGDELYRFCVRLAMNRADADDLYQETFLRALEKRERLAAGSGPDGWADACRKNRNFLMGIAVNLWKNQWRKKKREQKNISISSEEYMDLWLSDGGDIGEKLEQREIQHRLTVHIESLPVKLKTVVYMFYSAEMKIEEIADTLHIPQGTVKSRLYLARTKLKKSLEADGYEI